MAISFAASESGSASFIDNAAPTTLVTNSQGAGLIVRIEKLILLNVNVAARYVTLYKVPSGGSISGDDYKIAWLLEVPASANDAGNLDVRSVAGLMLENGDSLRALASAASSVRFDISYAKES